jgi:hypothetical protein
LGAGFQELLWGDQAGLPFFVVEVVQVEEADHAAPLFEQTILADLVNIPGLLLIIILACLLLRNSRHKPHIIQNLLDLPLIPKRLIPHLQTLLQKPYHLLELPRILKQTIKIHKAIRDLLLLLGDLFIDFFLVVVDAGVHGGFG